MCARVSPVQGWITKIGGLAVDFAGKAAASVAAKDRHGQRSTCTSTGTSSHGMHRLLSDSQRSAVCGSQKQKRGGIRAVCARSLAQTLLVAPLNDWPGKLPSSGPAATARSSCLRLPQRAAGENYKKALLPSPACFENSCAEVPTGPTYLLHLRLASFFLIPTHTHTPLTLPHRTPTSPRRLRFSWQ